MGSMVVSTHAFGGARMGDDPETNVVDRFGFSHEVPNLGVLGASVIGTSGARNPTLTARALAWRTTPACVISGVMIMLSAAPAHAEPAEYRIDPEHVTVAFLVGHAGYAKVLGQFLEIEGSYMFDEETGALSDIEVIVNTASVFSNHDDRDDHLRSGDFLNSRRNPEMTFTADTGARTSQRTFEVTGQLELLGVARPLTLQATWNKSDDYPFGRSAYVMGVSARGAIMRSEFGMSYASSANAASLIAPTAVRQLHEECMLVTGAMLQDARTERNTLCLPRSARSEEASHACRRNPLDCRFLRVCRGAIDSGASFVRSAVRPDQARHP